ncbi:MAG: DUF6427 family protein [Bacteroidota bacterium]
MIGIFKNNLFFNSLLLLPYVVVLRIHSLLFPVAYVPQETDTLITKLVFGTVTSALTQNILAVILLYFHVIYINRLVIKHRIANEITLIPGLIYAVMVSFLPEYSLLTPFVFANTFVLLCIGQIFKTYKRPKSADILFNIGFLIALAANFVSNYIALLLVGLIGLFVLRSMKMVEIMQLISGSFLVLVAFSGILYLLDLPILVELNKASIIPRLSILQLRGLQLYKLLAIAGVAVFTVLSYGTYTIKKNIQTQKKVDILYWFMIASLVLLLVNKTINPSLSLLLFIPAAILLNTNYLNLKRILVQEVIHIVVLIFLFALNFGLI